MAKRRLTDIECNYIVSKLKKINAGTKDIAEKNAQEINYVNILQLRDYEVYPEIVEQLCTTYYNTYLKSIIHPGKTIGMAQSAALGGPLTQLNLNTFHQVGSAKSVGIEAFKELFNGTAIRKDEVTLLHFINKNMTYEEVVEHKKYVVCTSIGSLLSKKPEIIENKNIDYWWYPLYLDIVTYNSTEVKVLDSNKFLRLKFNINLLFKYKITLTEIVNKLEIFRDVKILNCVPSPLHLGIIDVYPITSKIMDVIKSTIDDDSSEGIYEDNAAIIYLQQVLIPNLDSLLIKGVENIRNLLPVSINMYSLFINEEMDKDNNWYLWIDLIKIRTYGGGIKKIFDFLESANIKILNKKSNLPNSSWEEKDFLEGDGRSIHVSMPKIIEKIENGKITFLPENKEKIIYLLNKSKITILSEHENEITVADNVNIQFLIMKNNSPLTYLKIKIDNEDQEIRNWVNTKRSTGVILPKYNYSNFYRCAKYVYAELSGTNLKKILSLPFSDSSNTISNNPHEMLQVFGIETCRNYIALNFYQMLSDTGSYIYPGYINLIPDFMTNKGIIIAMTSKGITQFGRGAFADASFQEPFSHFIKAAVSGRNEPVEPTSGCVFLGKRIPIGTGLSKIILDKTILEELNLNDKSEFTNEEKNFKGGISIEESITLKDEDTFDEKVKKLAKKTVTIILTNNVGKKGPVPIVQKMNITLPQIVVDLIGIKQEKEEIIPKLHGLTIEKSLSKLYVNFNVVEKKVNFVDIDFYIQNINKYI